MINKPPQEVTRLAKWLMNLETAATRSIQEGVCDECGAYDTVYNMGDCHVCSICRKNLSSISRKR